MNKVNSPDRAKVKNEAERDDLVCYCFQYTKADIEADFIKNGESTILKKIILAKKGSTCDCAIKSPWGR